MISSVLLRGYQSSGADETKGAEPAEDVDGVVIDSKYGEHYRQNHVCGCLG